MPSFILTFNKYTTPYLSLCRLGISVYRTFVKIVYSLSVCSLHICLRKSFWMMPLFTSTSNKHTTPYFTKERQKCTANSSFSWLEGQEERRDNNLSQLTHSGQLLPPRICPIHKHCTSCSNHNIQHQFPPLVAWLGWDWEHLAFKVWN
jgi:hypothetical protein